jgi:hypothetical protein
MNLLIPLKQNKFLFYFNYKNSDLMPYISQLNYVLTHINLNTKNIPNFKTGLTLVTWEFFKTCHLGVEHWTDSYLVIVIIQFIYII